jgi:hypothetical protein
MGLFILSLDHFWYPLIAEEEQLEPPLFDVTLKEPQCKRVSSIWTCRDRGYLFASSMDSEAVGLCLLLEICEPM